MAKAYKCDRCGKFFNRIDLSKQYSVIIRASKSIEDLCPKCNEELDNWMKNFADFVTKDGNNQEGEING